MARSLSFSQHLSLPLVPVFLCLEASCSRASLLSDSLILTLARTDGTVQAPARDCGSLRLPVRPCHDGQNHARAIQVITGRGEQL
eukprot:1619295-Rhodomonas_salina.2